MYRIILENIENKYDFNELIKIFLPESTYELFTSEEIEEFYELGELYGEEEPEKEPTTIIKASGFSKNAIKQELYNKLSKLTGKTPKWGIHTGVRPIKLVCELFDRYDDETRVRDELNFVYMLAEDKLKLSLDIAKLQRNILKKAEPKSVGLYIGIPFCPTRCLYCSFTSNELKEEKVSEYLSVLHREIEFTGSKMRQNNQYPESIYVGGGTPTTLSARELDELLSKMESSYDLSKLKEFTVECGRADTITIEKLRVLKEHKVGRISINPQSMKDETLVTIGRAHTRQQVLDAFNWAYEIGGFIINADVIAGLPKEDLSDFESTLRELINLDVDNITVHTLAVKRGSRLIDADSSYHRKHGDIADEMVDLAGEMLRKSGYAPYYLYRQKHMAGALENTGYSKPGTESIYNIRIMDEHQSIVALGAGGISKAYYPKENRLIRVPNVSNYEIYIKRIEDMLQRKEENLFTGGELC